MQNDFASVVQDVVGPLLADMGFVLSKVEDDIDEGGRKGAALYYYGPDCKIQIYRSSREGEINAMIGPLRAPDEFGLHNQSRLWHYLNDFADEPKLPLEQLIAQARNEHANFTTTPKWLEWIRTERIARYYDSAHRGIQKNYQSE